MATKGHITGMRGVFLVAAELTRLGFIVSLTSRGAKGADLLVTDSTCNRAFSVQVKTNAAVFSFFLVGKGALVLKSPTHIYVLVNIKRDITEMFVVPSKELSKLVRETTTARGTWYDVQTAAIQKYSAPSSWKIFGKP
jgi:hypothetical protein